jgi:hypothetical protein
MHKQGEIAQDATGAHLKAEKAAAQAACAMSSSASPTHSTHVAACSDSGVDAASTSSAAGLPSHCPTASSAAARTCA